MALAMQLQQDIWRQEVNPTPLNPDALEAGAKALYNEEPWQKSTYSVESHSWEEIQEEDRQAFREEAEVAVSAYLAAAQPVVNSVEELDKLPVGTVVIDADEYVARKERESAKSAWAVSLHKFSKDSNALALPATVLNSPPKTLPVVNSLEDLAGLPVGSVVRGGEHDLVGEKIRHSPYPPHWCTIGEEVEANERDLLPARVLYRPTEELTNGR